MRTDTTRAFPARIELTLPSDLTVAEWGVSSRCFRRYRLSDGPQWPIRLIVEAILYLLRCSLPGHVSGQVVMGDPPGLSARCADIATASITRSHGQ